MRTAKLGAIRIGLAVVALAMLLAAASGLGTARAQEATPGATPEGTPMPSDCTADLGIVRSAKTCVAVVHAAPDAPAVDVYVDGMLFVEGLAFGEASRHADVPAGTHRLQVVEAGGDVANALLDVPALELVAGRAYEVAVLGGRDALTAGVYDVDVYAIPGDAFAGMTRVRVVHAAPDAPPLDVSLVGGDIAQRLDAGLAFPDAGSYRELSAGTYRLLLNVAETGEAVLNVPSVPFERDTVYGVYAVGRVDDGSLRLLLVAARASRLPAPATPAASPTA